MVRTEAQSLRQYLANASSARFFWDRTAQACVNHLARGTSLGGRLGELAGKSVLVATSSQLTTALALIELDGEARRLTILPPDTAEDYLGALIAEAEADAVVVDDGTPRHVAFDLPVRVVCEPDVAALEESPLPHAPTEWVLLTSGTVGVPKMAAHTLASLTAPIGAGRRLDGAVVWGTFYDIRRYGGLQIFLRAVVGGASLILSSAGEPVAGHLARLARYGVTHLSGTPSHWRRALMSPEIRKISPRYVRLSGEIADQAVLDSLHAIFPEASVGHAYASTEAGVAFEVGDGLAGFPATFLEQDRDGVAMKVTDGSLRIRSPRTASRYLGAQPALQDRDSFVDTGDMIERQGDRCMFAGRRGGIINVGGQKVHPEEIEAVINRHPQVRMSLVRPKQSPVTGAIVIADVVLRADGACAGNETQLKHDILDLCRRTLPRHKVPAAISIVSALDVAATGKLARRQG
ncbi:MAG TPA: class I adenylate-forming enzyme family protein [Xanthobacteraceae bacterium]|nr:class I adenylate-forming enzyme family protein [Xanthobacteraceae bacterium]